VPTPGKYRPLLGIYTRPGLGGWMLRLEWRDGKLTFVAPEMALWQLVLEPTSNPDVFIAEPGSGFPGEPVVLVSRSTGTGFCWSRQAGVAAARNTTIGW